MKKLNQPPNNLAIKPYRTSEEAYRFYLQATVLVDKQNRKDAEKAVEYFARAVTLDPYYALAYASMENAHTAVDAFGGEPHEQSLKARAAVEKALAFDENLAAAHAERITSKQMFSFVY